jgi:hypothetical protein
MRPRLLVPSIACALTLAACSMSAALRPGVDSPVPTGQMSPRNPPRVAPSMTDSLAGRGGKVVARKEVAGKEDPSTLVAADASRCSVSARQYKRTKVGDEVRCAWSAGGDR